MTLDTTLDIRTLFIVTVFIMSMSGCLLLFAWLRNRASTALLWWGVAMLTMAPATAMFGLRGVLSDFWTIVISNALFLGGYGLLWSGTRAFERRRPRFDLAFAGVAIWIAACCFESFLTSLQARIVLISSLGAAYSLLFIGELWRGRADGLISRWPTIAVMGLHAMLHLVRVPLVAHLPFPMGVLPQSQGAASLFILSLLFFSFCLPFLMLALAKEQGELEHKRAALIDALTGIPNRRGFGERAARVVARCQRDETPLTLLLLDLDHFKTINDRFGHRIGDAVLVRFSRTTTQALRPLDLLGRIGGEEFVALLPDVGPDAALDIAERIRKAFAASALTLDGHSIEATVSIGSASASKAGYDFEALYASADAALYLAKQKGRNRVERGRPVLAALPNLAQI